MSAYAVGNQRVGEESFGEEVVYTKCKENGAAHD